MRGVVWIGCVIGVGVGSVFLNVAGGGWGCA